MNTHRYHSLASSYKCLILGMIVALLAAFVPAAMPVTAVVPLRADPALMASAEAIAPAAPLRVIVQKQAANNALESIVRGLGGEITKDLRIINGFAATIPAQALPTLARAEGVRWVSLDAPVNEAQKGGGTTTTTINTSKLKTTFNGTINAIRVWNSTPSRLGRGIGVAVVDSGVDRTHPDFRNASGGSRVPASTKFNSNTNTANDGFGHGTHVAGLIAGYARTSNNEYLGVAPEANILNVKVSDDIGSATASDVVNGLQWVLDNKAAYNIRVVNLSLNSSVYESYQTSPLCAAVEILWFNGIVVVVSAGNSGSATLYPPANDPFVITVGATDDRNTTSRSDDIRAPFSAAGVTGEGFTKPEMLAPGTKLYSTISGGSVLAKTYPQSVVKTASGATYFKLSGTSMATPLVAGTVALLLEDEPNLTPDQVKYRLINTGSTFSGTTARYLDAYATVYGTTTASANTGIQASALLTSGGTPVTWNSMAWNSVAWNSVAWNSMAWNSMAWNSTFFGDQTVP